MDELDFVEKFNLRISPKTGLPTKAQKVKINCSVCGKESFPLWMTLKNYVMTEKPYVCKHCILSQEITARNIANTGLTAEERLGEEKGKAFREKMSLVTKGEKNGMYGKHFSDESKQKMSKAQIGRSYEDKFGKEKAAEMKKNLSERFSGEGNSMYGKPSPKGSGNGWSGWFKNFYFRSLLELSFLVKNPQVKSAESIRIPYVDYKGTNRNYLPDYIDGNTIIEIKPFKLLTSDTNIRKIEAGKRYCKEHNLEFKVLTENDIERLTLEDVNILYENKDIKFLERYEIKFRKYLEENKQCH